MVNMVKTKANYQPTNTPGILLFPADISDPASIVSQHVAASVTGFSEPVWGLSNSKKHLKCYQQANPYDFAGLVHKDRLFCLGEIQHMFNAGSDWFHKLVWVPSGKPGLYGQYPIVLSLIDINLMLLPNIVSCLTTLQGLTWKQSAHLQGATYFEYGRAKPLIDTIISLLP